MDTCTCTLSRPDMSPESIFGGDNPHLDSRIVCRSCSQEEHIRWGAGVNRWLFHEKLCFDCDFWLEYVERASESTSIRVDGRHYIIGDEQAVSIFRGHGGREFRIEFKDGRIVTSTNLWQQGEIPERFRDKLPDNAVFT